MKVMFFALALLSFSAFAHADENYYYCVNLDSNSKAPAATMAMATADGLAGLFCGANFCPPRAMFDAPPTVVTNPQDLSFGTVQWSGGNNGFTDFQSAEALFSAQGVMTSIKYTFGSDTAEYGNCTLQGDN